MENAPTETPCEICGGLESFILAKTGYGETLPAPFYRLTKGSLANDLDIRCCPKCDAIFVWEDHPQFYGSGNLDEEHLTRLSAADAGLVREFQNLPDDPIAAPDLMESAFARLDQRLTIELLKKLRFSRSAGFNHLLPALITRLQKTSDYSLRELIFGFCRDSRIRSRRIAELIDADPRPKNYQSEELRKQCAQWVDS